LIEGRFPYFFNAVGAKVDLAFDQTAPCLKDSGTRVFNFFYE